MRLLEGRFIEAARAEVAENAADAPSDVEGFIGWFEALKTEGPGQSDILFDWIAEDASLEQLRWFLRQEAAGEAGLDALVALTQVKLAPRPQLEQARH